MQAELTKEREIKLIAETDEEEEALVRFGQYVNTLLSKKTCLTVVLPKKGEKPNDC